jgi:hypothetical protein
LFSGMKGSSAIADAGPGDTIKQMLKKALPNTRGFAGAVVGGQRATPGRLSRKSAIPMVIYVWCRARQFGLHCFRAVAGRFFNGSADDGH